MNPWIITLKITRGWWHAEKPIFRRSLFETADQNTYLPIVRYLVAQAGIVLEQKNLEFRALQWATRYNGRSGRTARQFVDFLSA
ncbi:DUF815 domain-containing protein [Synechocystis sp. LEGE 06083]|uniref:DUF815 domain-containing protein n=1 Tax=Synechocystis sp. LEGE 06083 TaxID=915336 RepID=UPI001880F5AA|nr:DUF815 domain-containing protein [Synechocystis sp. LEGE 06083]MBE9196114.1 DUF815 domain-containing protein [Synechocystis sp. LEGE 06083]